MDRPEDDDDDRDDEEEEDASRCFCCSCASSSSFLRCSSCSCLSFASRFCSATLEKQTNKTQTGHVPDVAARLVSQEKLATLEALPAQGESGTTLRLSTERSNWTLP